MGVPLGALKPTLGLVMWRLAREPSVLPRVDPSAGPTHRFDDPDQSYAVRYLGQDVYTCLLETMQRFRPPHDEVDALLAQVEGADVGDHAPNLGNGLRDWLAEQQVAQVVVVESSARIVVINDAFDALCAEPAVRDVMTACFPDAQHVDAGHVLSGNGPARALTQAISRAVYIDRGRPAGIEYPSRRDLGVVCWAIFDRVAVDLQLEERLNRHNEAHLHAVQRVCNRYGILPPPGWS